MIKLKKSPDHINTLIFDMQDRPFNVINHEIGNALLPVLEHLEEEKAKGKLKGLIITSAKRTFLIGGDLEYLHKTTDPAQIFEYTESLKKVFRQLESPEVPVVAALNGSALGTGFELALACHHRIAVDHAWSRFGHPEINLGMMPGGGAVIRLLWLLGIQKSFDLLKEGKRFPAKEALDIGIIDALADNEEQMMDKARQWILENPEARKPWDRPGHAIPGGTAHDISMARVVRDLAAGLSESTRNNFDAPAVILQTLAEGSKVGFKTASLIESRGFASLVATQRARNMTKAFWFDLNAIEAGANRPKGFGKFRPNKVGIIGSGQMGSGIALACVRRGIQVIIKDISTSVAARSKNFVAQALQDLEKKGNISSDEGKQYLNQISTSENSADFKGCDLVIEAVFENENIKVQVTQEAEKQLDDQALFATNTSSIPIARIAKHSVRPQNFVGLHFFSPAETVPLVEVVTSKETSQETIAKAMDFVLKIKKIPLLVKDSWGFYASRVKNTYLLEGIELLREGYPPALIENLGRQSGMPEGPLASTDDIGLEYARKYESQAAVLYGPKYIQHPAVGVLDIMVQELNRKGKEEQNGFYDYQEGERQCIWPALSNHFSTSKYYWDAFALKERMLFVQVIEAAWCLEERVVRSKAEANLGSIHGWGFPSWTGGVIQYIYNYGKEAFINRCKVYENLHGPRFKVPKYILELKE